MDLKDKNRWGLTRLLRSFVYAWSGLRYVLVNEQNMRIHLLIGTVIIFVSFMLDVSKLEKVILLLVIGVVFSLEVMNTAIERTIDFVTNEYHPLAKIAKDIAAAAVFVFSLIAVIIGLIILLPPLLAVFI
ncbi:diacylglycerol kinase family protein [Alkalihalobacillus sp. LMS39]|uniref:diacylglycerol kinase n=1 Tax=Alkalihalobacillus sp. LMS39 TaxID=2924032 RepID=UPI001FB4F393|nr:diacylglycerol kinase family protein [Alkalihalobacillus sp. LMS39]UOE95675.1 diacylglycerol kinase family protein [Alkalihalobacillus sp. LMS39]